MRTLTTEPGRPRSLTSAVSRRWRVTLARRPPTVTRAVRAPRGSAMRKLRLLVQRFGAVCFAGVEDGEVAGEVGAGSPAAGGPDCAAGDGQAVAGSLKR